jgi:peptidoglycan/LPS O-acetylase OafA/YrhL
MYTHILSYCYVGYFIPGVFTHNAYNAAANGSIWTIRYELAMYALLLGGALCGMFRNKLIATLILLFVIIGSMIRPDVVVLVDLTNIGPSGHLPAFFAFGSLLALHKENVRIDGRVAFGTILIACVFHGHAGFQAAFYPAFLITCLWLISTPPVMALRLPGDFSYGVYVFGWPIQQTYESLFPHAGVYANQALSIPTALLFGALSWYFVEKPSIALGRRSHEIVSAWLSFAKRKYRALRSSDAREIA